MKPGDSFTPPYFEQGVAGPAAFPPPPPPPPATPRTLFSRLFNGDQKYAFFCWIISIIQIGVFIGELIKNAQETKTPIEIQPTFNPLIGPSSEVHNPLPLFFPLYKD